jgi:hypothetical protein
MKNGLYNIVLDKFQDIFRSAFSFPVVSGVPRNFFEGGLRQEFSGGVQQIQLRTEGRENGDLGGGSPLVRGSTQLGNE